MNPIVIIAGAGLLFAAMRKKNTTMTVTDNNTVTDSQGNTLPNVPGAYDTGDGGITFVNEDGTTTHYTQYDLEPLTNPHNWANWGSGFTFQGNVDFLNTLYNGGGYGGSAIHGCRNSYTL